VGRLRTAAEALRTQLAALSQQQSQAAQAEAARPHTRGAKEAAVRREQEAAQLLSRQQEMTDKTVQLPQRQPSPALLSRQEPTGPIAGCYRWPGESLKSK
jgi:septal ring factor EnvC (AmiA/AmiB activator)